MKMNLSTLDEPQTGFSPKPARRPQPSYVVGSGETHTPTLQPSGGRMNGHQAPKKQSKSVRR
jgi:hypothetical protein